MKRSTLMMLAVGITAAGIASILLPMSTAPLATASVDDGSREFDASLGHLADATVYNLPGGQTLRESRGEIWLVTTGQRELLGTAIGNPIARSAQLSPDGKFVAVPVAEGEVVVLDTTTLAIQRLRPTSGPVVQASWSADSRSIICCMVMGGNPGPATVRVS